MELLHLTICFSLRAPIGGLNLIAGEWKTCTATGEYGALGGNGAIVAGASCASAGLGALGRNNLSGAQFYCNGTVWIVQGAIDNTNGNMGIGTITPSAKLEINGNAYQTLKIIDGNQASGKILTSDATGQASWQAPVVAASSPSGVGTPPVCTGNNALHWSGSAWSCDAMATSNMPPACSGANTLHWSSGVWACDPISGAMPAPIGAAVGKNCTQTCVAPKQCITGFQVQSSSAKTGSGGNMMTGYSSGFVGCTFILKGSYGVTTSLVCFCN